MAAKVYKSRIIESYEKEVVPALTKKFGYKNPMQVPKLVKIMTIAIKVTLRGKMMYDFYDKLVSLALPRVRDFRGVPADSFDGKGNYCMGLKEQLVFPEIQYDQVEKIRGMDICFVTTAKTDEEARELLRAMGMPFKK